MNTNERNAAIELRLIELELRNRTPQHLRHFVDQYYCYKHGIVNRNGGARWAGIVGRGHVSIEGRRLISDRKNIVKEHMVPIKVISKLLVELKETGDLTCATIAALLDRYVHFATISKNEDKKLCDMNLRSEMPPGFGDKGHEYYLCPYSRYKEAGILLE